MNLKVLAARRQLDLTQEQLAEQADLKANEISLIERAGWIPPPAARQRLAEALDTSVEDLFDLTADGPLVRHG